jgi:hypothetical protein
VLVFLAEIFIVFDTVGTKQGYPAAGVACGLMGFFALLIVWVVDRLMTESSPYHFKKLLQWFHSKSIKSQSRSNDSDDLQQSMFELQVIQK